MKKNLKIGDSYTEIFVLDDNKVKAFADVSGDKNPIHLDSNFAAKTIFKKNIVHGILVASLFSKILGNNLPGEGSIYLGQNLKFLRPVFVNEEIKIVVKIENIRQDKPIITLSTICYNSENEIAVEGEAIMKLLL